MVRSYSSSFIILYAYWLHLAALIITEICLCMCWGGWQIRKYLSLKSNTHRPEDTLYLEVTAPIVRPGLAVISDSGRTTIDFSNVGTGYQMF